MKSAAAASAKRSANPVDTGDDTEETKKAKAVIDSSATSMASPSGKQESNKTMFVLYAFTEFGEDDTAEDGAGSEILGIFHRKEDAIAVADDYVERQFASNGELYVRSDEVGLSLDELLEKQKKDYRVVQPFNAIYDKPSFGSLNGHRTNRVAIQEVAVDPQKIEK